MLVTFAWMVKQRDKINKSLMVMLFIQILLESCANASYHTSILNSYLTEDNFVQLAPSPNHRLQLQAKNQDQTHSQQPSTTDSRIVLQTSLISVLSKPIQVVVVVVVIIVLVFVTKNQVQIKSKFYPFSTINTLLKNVKDF